MKTLCFALLLSGGFLIAQNANPDQNSNSKGQITVQGCVSRESGDYILIEQNPAVTYELQTTGKIRLKHYLGQRVEVTGTQSPSLSTSSDTSARSGSPSSVTLTITSIKTLDKQCPAQ